MYEYERNAFRSRCFRRDRVKPLRRTRLYIVRVVLFSKRKHESRARIKNPL